MEKFVQHGTVAYVIGFQKLGGGILHTPVSQRTQTTPSRRIEAGEGGKKGDGSKGGRERDG